MRERDRRRGRAGRAILLLVALGTPVLGCRRASDPRGELAAQSDPNVVPGQVPAQPGARMLPGTDQPVVGALPGVVQMTTLGALHNGQLQPGDTMLPEGKAADQYVISLVAGSPVTIVARGGPSRTSPGSMLDMYLYLFFNGAEVAHDDDSAASGSALNSRIVYTPLVSGQYVIRVTTFGSGMREGSYTLQTYAGALNTQL